MFISRSISCALALVASAIVAASAKPAPPESDEVGYAKYLRAAAHDIDKIIAASFKRYNVKVPPLVDDTTFLRRTFLNTVGRIPTFEETIFFVEAEDEDKRGQIVKYLLDSPGYASHTINWFNDLFRMKDISRRTMHPYVFYMRNAAANNKPWDKMTSELLSARGSMWENGAAGYYVMDRGMEHDNLAISMRVFLGTRMECAQCHDNPEFLDDDWERKEFFELAAFVDGQGEANPALQRLYSKYRQADASVARGPLGSFIQSIYNNVGYTSLGGGGRGRTKLPYDYQYKDGDPGEWVGARTPFGPSMRSSDRKDAGDGRTQFAEWVTSNKNPRFAQTIANRLWKRIMGTGLYEPVDSFVEAEATSNPALTRYLSQLIVDLRYDMKAFQRVLLMTHTYQFDSNPVQIEPGETNRYNGRQLTRLSPEQLWDSLLALQVGNLDDLPTRKFDNRIYIGNQPVLEGKMNMKQLAQEVLKRRNQSELEQYLKELFEEVKASGKNVGGMSMMQRGAGGWQGLRGFVRASELASPAPADHFIRQFGQSERELVEGNTSEANVSQILNVLNGHVQRHIVENSQISMYKQLEELTSPEDKIRGIFLSILTRPPSDGELELMLAEVERSGPERAYRNITAALISTHEFLFLK